MNTTNKIKRFSKIIREIMPTTDKNKLGDRAQGYILGFEVLLNIFDDYFKQEINETQPNYYSYELGTCDNCNLRNQHVIHFNQTERNSDLNKCICINCLWENIMS